MILLHRLKIVGAEDRIWETQFGFRTGHGTADAVFIARPAIERALQSQHGAPSRLGLVQGLRQNLP